jgi:hypothetical protein
MEGRVLWSERMRVCRVTTRQVEMNDATHLCSPDDSDGIQYQYHLTGQWKFYRYTVYKLLSIADPGHFYLNLSTVLNIVL